LSHLVIGIEYETIFRMECVCDRIFFGEDGLAIQNYYFLVFTALSNPID
jgi:hypothetical protein